MLAGNLISVYIIINNHKCNKALETINAICFIPKINEIYKGTVKSIMPYGAFVGIGKNTDGLLHISEISWERLDNVESVLKEGDEIEVKLIEINWKDNMTWDVKK
mgnify:CR=1 FL=1